MTEQIIRQTKELERNPSPLKLIKKFNIGTLYYLKGAVQEEIAKFGKERLPSLRDIASIILQDPSRIWKKDEEERPTWESKNIEILLKEGGIMSDGDNDIYCRESPLLTVNGKLTQKEKKELYKEYKECAKEELKKPVEERDLLLWFSLNMFYRWAFQDLAKPMKILLDNFLVNDYDGRQERMSRGKNNENPNPKFIESFNSKRGSPFVPVKELPVIELIQYQFFPSQELIHEEPPRSGVQFGSSYDCQMAGYKYRTFSDRTFNLQEMLKKEVDKVKGIYLLIKEGDKGYSRILEEKLRAGSRLGGR
jgi:hypothetical protein